ncbi:uncharacterized protein LOC144866889 [Branchiostoma floridae x Branchiostoma japonicum]
MVSFDSPPDESILAEQRQKSAEKRKRRAAVLEVLVFGLFIAVVMATSYGDRSPMAFYMTQNVERQILETGDVGFFEIADIPSFWTWITTGLMPALHVRSWYNGRVSPDAMLLEDMVTYPLGPVQLRQVRVEPGQHCAPPNQMLNVTSRCSVPYSLSVADTQNYTLRWAPDNTTANGTDDTVCSPSSLQTSRELHNCADNVSPWRYTYASLTDGVPFFGQHGSYISGGYIAWLGTTDESMSFLQRQRWLDDKSRAVFIELILYNPHVNLFSVVSLVVEFTNLGAAYKSSEIVTVRLIQQDVILLLVMRGLLALFLLYFVFREGKSLMSRPLEYLGEFWSWVELLVIIVGFSTLVVYFYTQNIIDEVAEQRRNGNSVFHLYKSAVIMQFFLLTIFMVILFEVYENGDWTTNPYDIGFTSFLKETAEESAEKIKGTSLKTFFLASLTVYYANSSPCKPPVEHVCSCKNGQLSTDETCTVCACSQDGNFRRCETSRWLDIPSSWISDESSSRSCTWRGCRYTLNKAKKAFDGDASTFWEPKYRPDGYQHWVVVDLQTTFAILRLSISNDGGGDQDVVSFIVESSPVSPYAWEIAHSSDAVIPGTSDPQEFRLDFVSRFVRLKFDTQSGSQPIIKEVALFGQEITGGTEGLSCPTLNTGCVISDTVGELAPPGGQNCYVTAEIHEGVRSRESPLQVHRTGNVVLHGNLLLQCEEDHELQIFWTARGYNQTAPDEPMVDLLPIDTPRNNIHFSLAPRTLPLGVHMIQLQVIMNVTGSGHVSVSAAQTWVEFVRLPVVYSLGSSLRTVPTSGDIQVNAGLSYDPEEIFPSSAFTYNWKGTVLSLPECGLFSFRHVPDSDCSTGGVDIAGYSGVSLQFCAAACCAHSNCLSFQYNDAASCYLKPRLCTDGEKSSISVGNMYDRLTDNLGANVAVGRTTSSSPIYAATYGAEKAVDGITATSLDTGSCFHSDDFTSNPWLQIDLSRPIPITNVLIYNRMDCCSERINPFNLHLGNSSDIQANGIYGGDLNFDLSQATMTIPVTGVTSRYVGLLLPGSSRTMNLCEVQVYTDDELALSEVTLGSQVAGSDPGVLVFESPTDVRPIGLIANITVEIIAGDFPPVTLHTIIQVVPDDSLGELSLQCEALSRQENCDPSKTASTEPLELFTECQIFGTTEFTLEEFPAAFAGQDWTAGIDSYLSDDTRLRVVAGTFWAEGYYTIRLTDHHLTDDADWTRIAEWRFNVYPTPVQLLEGDSSDACTMMPTEGVSLIDKFCAKCVDFADVLGPLEVTITFELIPVGAEIAKSVFPGDGPPTDNRIFITASTQWVPYTPLVDLAAGLLLLTVRATSVDGRYTEFDLPPIERRNLLQIHPPTMSQLQSYLDTFFPFPDGDFFRTLALGDSHTAFKGSIFASAVTGVLAFRGENTIEVVDKIMEGLSNVAIDDVESINGVTISAFLATGIPEMVSGKSQVRAATYIRDAFSKTRELAENLEETPMGDINKMSAVMMSGSVNVLSASSTMAEKEQLDDNSYSSNLAYNREATTISFQALDIMDDIYLNKLMPEFSDQEIYADFSLSKLHLKIKRENRTRMSEKVYLVGGDSDCLVRVPSIPNLIDGSCDESEDVGIQFLESNFNPFEYSNNSNEVRTDVTGLGVKCGNRTLSVSGLSEPIDILTRRKNESLDGSVYIFKASVSVGNLTVFEFLVGKEQSTLGFDIDFNSTRFPQDVSLFLCKDCVPTQDAFNWTATLPVSEDQIVSVPWINGTNLTSSPYQWLLPGDEIGITNYDVGNLTQFSIGVQFGSDLDLDEEEIVDFSLTVFESSCVYFDEEVHLWHSDGCEVGPLTNMTHIHCRCDHLTKFAGFVPPNPLNIAQALSANVLENPAGMILVLTVFALYLFGILLTRKADRRDLLKAGVGILPGHTLNPRKECQYVITVYTGFRGNAGTTAEVTIVLGGLTKESIPFKLRDEKRVLFEKGSVDSFLLSTEEPLGELSHLRVWHNNKGYSPGWFLSQIVVTNRSRNNTTYFLCNRWLSVEEDDGKVHRILPRAVPEDLKKFRNLFLAKSARDMNDGHMWFSVVGRPARSPFTRVQRLSCCLTLLYSTMLTNIMFFGRGDDFEPPEPIRFAGVEINPPISLPQIMIGVQSAAIILPVNVLIAFLFRNSGPRGAKSTDKKAQKEGAEGGEKAKSSLPWWTVYIGWMLVWSASFVSAFFTVLYTLSFGRAKAEAWLVTFLTSFVTDLFLMQPFKLLIVAVIFALISKVSSLVALHMFL